MSNPLPKQQQSLGQKRMVQLAMIVPVVMAGCVGQRREWAQSAGPADDARVHPIRSAPTLDPGDTFDLGDSLIWGGEIPDWESVAPECKRECKRRPWIIEWHVKWDDRTTPSSSSGIFNLYDVVGGLRGVSEAMVETFNKKNPTQRAKVKEEDGKIFVWFRREAQEVRLRGHLRNQAETLKYLHVGDEPKHIAGPRTRALTAQLVMRTGTD